MKQYKFNKEDLINIGIDDRNFKDINSLCKSICQCLEIKYENCENIHMEGDKYYAPKIVFDVK